MKLKLDTGESTTVQLTARPHCSGWITIVDEAGRRLAHIAMSSDATEVRLAFETPWGKRAHCRVPGGSSDGDATMQVAIPRHLLELERGS